MACDRKQDFIGGRVLDLCDKAWPVCSTVAGCLLGPESYVEGRIPGSTEFVVELQEPSTVAVHVYLENIQAAGQDTAVSFYETGCINRTRLDATGNSLVNDTQQFGEFVQSADLAGLGDHLVSFESDTQARYTLKVEIIPKRAQPQ